MVEDGVPIEEVAQYLGHSNPAITRSTYAQFSPTYAFIAAGIGALLAGVALAGVWIYNNWSGLKVFFAGFWASFREALGPAGPMLDGTID